MLFDYSDYWKYRKNYSIGLFTDLNLYYEALNIAKKIGYINIKLLDKNLKERVIGLRYIETFKKSTFQDLIRELTQLKYLQKVESDFYLLTKSGEELTILYKQSISKYYDRILESVVREFDIPGWFVFRLWAINPSGQGQIVIPSPIKNWKPQKRRWENSLWDEELEKVSEETYIQINKKIPSSFPIKLNVWMQSLRSEYERLGKQKQRTISKKTNENLGKKMEFFTPRLRLTVAMKNISIKLLFSREFNKKADFVSGNPVNPRNFRVWCPRLETFELIYYSDFFEDIPGRVVFPCSAFRDNTVSKSFEKITFIKSPDGKNLYRHRPSYELYKKTFLETILEVYERIYNQEGIIYVSLQQVRDEVCRLLRISAVTFESFLQNCFRESVERKINFSISLETDIREDQKNAFQLNRRPVYINNIPNSLIAIKNFR